MGRMSRARRQESLPEVRRAMDPRFTTEHKYPCVPYSDVRKMMDDEAEAQGFILEELDAVKQVLTDLIAELRDRAEDVAEHGDKTVPWRIVANYLNLYADRAEQRLEKVQR